MAKTYYEASLWTPQESWRAVRNVRASPPEPLASVLSATDRADVFHMALEQSEQLFRSASSVERETRPILLFYGIGQAGRALAAASKRLGSTEWRGSGHGLKTDLNEMRPANIWALRTSVAAGRSDLFSRASIALASATDIADVRLGEAAANIVEFVHEFDDLRAYPRLAWPGSITLLESWFNAQHPEGIRFPVRVDDEAIDHEFLATVPALSTFSLWREQDGTPSRDNNGNLLVALPITAIDIYDGRAHLRDRQNYRGMDVLVRALGGATTPVHPLMAWWLILYPLSMLARYEPRKWQQTLDVRTSASWSQIEYLADRALDAVPQLLAQTLQTLNDGERS